MEGDGKITRRQDVAISTEPAVVYWTTLSHHLSGQTDRNNLKSQSEKPVGLETAGGILQKRDSEVLLHHQQARSII